MYSVHDTAQSGLDWTVNWFGLCINFELERISSEIRYYVTILWCGLINELDDVLEI